MGFDQLSIHWQILIFFVAIFRNEFWQCIFFLEVLG